MALTTRADLVAAVQALINRTDFATGAYNVYDFVTECMNDVDSRQSLARHRRRICRTTGTVSNEYEATKSDHLAIQSLELDVDGYDNWRLELITPEELANRKQTEADWASGITTDTAIDPAPPKYFSVVGTEYRFFPAPQTSYDARFTIYERLHWDDEDKCWLLTYYPNVLLYGAAIRSPTMIDHPDLPEFTRRFEQGILEAAGADPLPADPNVIRADTPPLRQASGANTFRP